MSTTFIDTGKLPRVALPTGQGAMTEILNRDLCGAKNVVGTLRWLDTIDSFAAEAKADTHQLLYFMEGDGTITLEGKDYDVAKGAGIYLGPKETARIRPRGKGGVKLFHLVVPKIKD